MIELYLQGLKLPLPWAEACCDSWFCWLYQEGVENPPESTKNICSKCKNLFSKKSFCKHILLLDKNYIVKLKLNLSAQLWISIIADHILKSQFVWKYCSWIVTNENSLIDSACKIWLLIGCFGFSNRHSDWLNFIHFQGTV